MQQVNATTGHILPRKEADTQAGNRLGMVKLSRNENGSPVSPCPLPFISSITAVSCCSPKTLCGDGWPTMLLWVGFQSVLP